MIIKFNKYKLYEFKEIPTEGGESKDLFMKRLYDKIKKDIIPNISSEFNVYNNDNKEIVIKTDNEDDLKVGIKIKGDNISFYSKPIDEPEYEYSFTFNPFSFNEIFKMIKEEFDKNKNKEIKHPSTTNKEIPKPIGRDLKDYKSQKDITLKDAIKMSGKTSKRVKRSISIPIVQDVLEDAYIMDEIDLKNISVDELIRRMKYRDRK